MTKLPGRKAPAWLLWSLLGSLLSVAPVARAQNVFISEFLASNTQTLADEDGEYRDWVELYNPLDTAVDLEGWALTDDLEVSDKWVFPAVTIGAKSTLLVWVSDKNRRDPAGPLHANFRLSSNGEALGLIAPGGKPVSLFAPEYPDQLSDTSYGVSMEIDTNPAIGDDGFVKYLVPSDDSLGLGWTELAYDDAGWTAAENGIGFDEKNTPTYDGFLRSNISEQMRRENASVYLRFPFEVTDPSAALSLQARYDDGFIAYVNGVEVARRNAPDDATWNSRGTRRSGDAGIDLETITISTAGLLREGTNVLAIHGMNDSTSGSDFLFQAFSQLTTIVSYDILTKQYFTSPTPGAPNTDGRMGVVAAPEFSVPGGPSTDEISVELSTETEGAEIYYTTDQSEPTRESTKYEGAITINDPTRVKAKAFHPDLVPSRTRDEYYLLVNENVFAGSRGIPNGTRLPIFFIDLTRAPNENTYTDGYMAMIDNEAAEGEYPDNKLTDPFRRSTRIGLKLHGSSSLGFDKKNLRVETRDDTGDDRGVRVGSLPRQSDWLLHGPYSDKSLLRNALSYEYSNMIGQYAPRTRPVELYFKTRPGGSFTSGNYWGVYILVERIKRDEDRVDIERVLPIHDSMPEISGGYIFKKDRADGAAEQGFNTGRFQLRYVEPQQAELTAAQRSWITNWFREMERALYGQNFADPEEGYEKYLDVDSFIDHHIIVELCKNIDGYRLSTYMHKKREGKLFMGPVWDYNLSLGNANYLNGAVPTGWYYPQVGAGDYPWYARLHQDPGYLARYRERWKAHRAAGIATSRLMEQIALKSDLISEAAQRNFARWNIMGRYIWPNEYIADSWEEEVEWMRDTWLTRRLTWMDDQFIIAPSIEPGSGVVDKGTIVTIESPEGPAYYTINGPDPASEDGGIAPEAVMYTEPFPVNENSFLQVRSRIADTGWTRLVSAGFVTDPLPVVVTEIHYHPLDADEEDAPTSSGSSYEFLEIMNIGDEPVDLSGMTHGNTRIRFTVEEGTMLASGEVACIVKNEAAFRWRHGDEPRIVAVYSGLLSNTRADIELEDGLGGPIQEFRYEDWIPETDGDGYSMVINDPFGARDSWGEETSWSASAELHGNPGRLGSGGPTEGLRLVGDIDSSGSLNVSDAVRTLRHLFQGGTELPCASEGGNLALLDTNGDSELNLTDPVQLLGFLFQQGAPPALGSGCVLITDCEDACLQ
ncbi:MAG: CotH kinase family protein [Planctomycetota bacterium]